MKPLLIFLLMSIIALTHCESNLPIIGKSSSEKESLYSKVTQMCFFVRLLGGPSGYKIVDNNDGTVALVSYSSLGADYCPPPFGKTESTSVVYYIKKCIQGQVYRQAQNDCKGTGTAANYYGAQKLQACTTNITCSDSVSPSMSSCANDTTTGKIWKPGNFQTGTSISTVRGYLKSRIDEIPSGVTDYYWNDSSNLFASDINGKPSLTASDNLASYNYVLCFNNKA